MRSGSTSSRSGPSNGTKTPILKGFPKSPKGTELRLRVDRCLPPRVAAGLDRFDWIHAVALFDVYTHDERVEDVQFIKDAGLANWCVVTQNPRMVRNQQEAAAIHRFGTQVFCLARADYSPVTQGLILGRNIMRIRRRAKVPGACFWRISEREPRRDI
jgi:predicted nuclease of predicted toxin-antitoxin system